MFSPKWIWLLPLAIVFIFITESHTAIVNSGSAMLASQTYLKPSVEDTAGLVLLGKKLFYDPILSGNKTISCASCHIPEFAFSDTVAFSKGINGTRTRRNSMSLTNLVKGHMFFWDGRVKTLEEQVLFPIMNPIEMGEDSVHLLRKLTADASYFAAFGKLYGEDKITLWQISHALSVYVRTLSSYRAPFDLVAQSVRTNKDMSDDQMITYVTKYESKNFVKTLYLCEGCHADYEYGGNHLKNNGLPILRGDSGLALITHRKSDIGVFKAPTLRNLAYTAPYMHDGRFKTLEEVVDYYNSGIQMNDNLDSLLIENGRPIRLNLTDEDKRQIVKFLRLLSDSSFVREHAGAKGY